MSANLIIKYLSRFDEIPFCLKYLGENNIIGKGQPMFTVELKEDISIKSLMNSTTLALGEAYIKGTLNIEGDLYQALNNFLSQINKFTTNTSELKKLLFTSSSKRNQKKEVSSHYDIGNDFYELWLDETLSYSCGYFKEDTNTLKEAQINKIDRILDKLYLKPNMNLLDIGCGWGSLLISAAKVYGVSGVGITLSKEQYNGFKKRVEKEKLENKIQVELMDYRDLPKSGYLFDRIVSVGMLEHVGRENYGDFLKSTNAVLKPQGLFLLHYISAQKEYPGNPWIKKYIFPGGVIPSLREIVNILPEFNYHILDIESLRRHYNKTLLCWDENFNKHRKEIEEKKGKEFCRMWDLYLCSCAAAFSNGIVDLHQVLISKEINNQLPINRWY